MQKEERPFDAYIEQAAVLFDAGKIQNALELYGKVMLQSQEPYYLKTAKQWLTASALLEHTDEKTICRFIACLIPAIDHCAEEEQEELFLLCLKIIRALTNCTPRQDTTDRYVVECTLLRHRKKTEEALEAVLTGIKLHNTASRATFAGLCYIDLEEEEQAEKYMQMGFQLDQKNGSGYNDMGDYFFQRRRYQKAEKYYKMVTTYSERYDCEWAEPSWLFCRYILHRSSIDLERLITYAAAYLENTHAARLCELARYYALIPYVEYLPGSSEASIHILRSARENGQSFTKGRIALTCLEAASCMNAIRLEMGSFGAQETKLELVVSRTSEPSFDTVLIPEGIRLWNYLENKDTVSVVEHPTKKAACYVKKLAETPFSLSAWYQEAAVMAGELEEEDEQGLYACMVYPPLPEDIHTPADEWLMRVQYAAVCLLAQLGSTYITAKSKEMQKWMNLLPSPQLARICLGQLDWPVIPALTLLAWQAKEGIAEVAPVKCLLNILLDRVSKQDYCFFEHALTCAFTWLPGQDAEFYQAVWEQKLLLEEE